MKPHRTDSVSLTFGLIFLGIVIIWLFNVVVELRIAEPGWVAAGALILFGLLGLLGALRSDRKKSTKPEAVPEPEPDDL
jgi:hypothetical protein